MLLPRWLQSLNPLKSQPPPSPHGELQSPPDRSHRAHIAANDPAFPAKREAAVALICQSITDIAAPFGYTRKGTTWSREAPHGKAAIHLQRSRYGFTADIILRFLTPDGNAPDTGLWAQDDEIRIARFYLPSESLCPEDESITYLDVSENPGSLDVPMRILADRALPWLDAHLTLAQPVEIGGFLPP